MSGPRSGRGHRSGEVGEATHRGTRGTVVVQDQLDREASGRVELEEPKPVGRGAPGRPGGEPDAGARADGGLPCHRAFVLAADRGLEPRRSTSCDDGGVVSGPVVLVDEREGFVGECAQVHGWLGREAMGVGDGDDGRLVEQMLEPVARSFAGAEAERQVEPPGGDVRGERSGGLLKRPDPNPRLRRVQPFEQPLNDEMGAGGVPDGELAASALSQLAGQLVDSSRGDGSGPRRAKRRLAVGGQGRSAAAALEEPEPELRLESLDPLRQGGLADVESFGGTSEVLLVCNNQERAQQADIVRHLIIWIGSPSHRHRLWKQPKSDRERSVALVRSSA